MVIHPGKNLVREAVIGRFEPHHIRLIFHMSMLMRNRKIQLLDSRPGRKKTMLSGVQQNLAKVVLWLAAHKKEVSPYDLRTFNFITPDVPLQTNECIYGHPRNRSRWTRGSESIKGSTGRDCPSAIGQPVEPFFSRSRTPYWMRECILAPLSGDRPIDPFDRPVLEVWTSSLDERG
ncbi:hypothetical protein AAG906_006825 [Vitis piasezkii]